MSMAKRSWQTHRVGQLHLTVEAEPLANHFARPHQALHLERRRGWSDAVGRILQLLEELRLPATWAVGDPTHSAVTELVTLSAVPHELALLGDSHWVGRTAGRKRFAHELSRRVTQARSHGIELATFVPRVAPVAQHIDLVVKQGFQAVVGAPDAADRTTRQMLPRLLHYGVWEISATDRLPPPRTWLPLARWKLRRALRRAAAETAPLHWNVDAAAVAQQGRAGWPMLADLLRQVAELRDRSMLRVETVGQTAAQLSERPAATPQRSILRAA